jgi:hypothetical protein
MSTKKDIVSKISKSTDILSQLRKFNSSSAIEAEQLSQKIISDLDFAKAETNINLNIESVKGVRTPKWYVLDIEFDTGDSQSKSRAFEISSEGAFVLSTLQAFYKFTSEDKNDYIYGNFFLGGGGTAFTPFGRYVPVSTFPMFGNGTLKNVAESASSSPAEVTIDNIADQSMYDIPEFSFNFEIDSVSNKWADKPIPGGFLYTLDNPMYFNGDCYVDRSERIIVTAKPDIRVPVKGIVRLVLHGYQILGEVTPENHNRI